MYLLGYWRATPNDSLALGHSETPRTINITKDNRYSDTDCQSRNTPIPLSMLKQDTHKLQ